MSKTVSCLEPNASAFVSFRQSTERMVTEPQTTNFCLPNWSRNASSFTHPPSKTMNAGSEHLCTLDISNENEWIRMLVTGRSIKSKRKAHLCAKSNTHQKSIQSNSYAIRHQVFAVPVCWITPLGTFANARFVTRTRFGIQSLFCAIIASCSPSDSSKSGRSSSL